MPSVTIIGAQWGDEGKAKIVDQLAEHADLVVRAQGGANAGHTIYFNKEKIVFHLLPSGVLHEKTMVAIGNGVVLDPDVLLQEMRLLQDKGFTITPDKLKISPLAHVVMPYHIVLDGLQEKRRANKIGTTNRGIGPCYEDKMSRMGIRVADMVNETVLKEKIDFVVAFKNELITKVYGAAPLDAEAIFEKYREYGKKLDDYVFDISYLIHDFYKNGKNVLFEGAQASCLDIDFGTYPDVTSSNTTIGGFLTGTGINTKMIDNVIGVMKAYTTRVGEGVFPSELNDAVGQRIRDIAQEYGATTGRPRRCGWLDLLAVKYAQRINGYTAYALTRLDMLDEFEEVKIAVGYKVNGEEIEEFLPTYSGIVEPVYVTFPGWQTPTQNIRSFEKLPVNAQKYITFIEEYLATPIEIVSVGPYREQSIYTNKVKIW